MKRTLGIVLAAAVAGGLIGVLLDGGSEASATAAAAAGPSQTQPVGRGGREVPPRVREGSDDVPLRPPAGRIPLLGPAAGGQASPA